MPRMPGKPEDLWTPRQVERQPMPLDDPTVAIIRAAEAEQRRIQQRIKKIRRKRERLARRRQRGT